MRKPEVRAVLKQKYEFYRDQVIAKVRALGPECRQSGDDSLFEDVWEEFKYQVQREESGVFEAYHELQLLWLDTEGYFDHGGDDGPPHRNELITGVERELYQRVVNCTADEDLRKDREQSASVDTPRASKATVGAKLEPMFLHGYHKLPGLSEPSHAPAFLYTSARYDSGPRAYQARAADQRVDYYMGDLARVHLELLKS
jgi:hypothetical protein